MDINIIASAATATYQLIFEQIIYENDDDYYL